jgi:hypothetical protein
MTALDNGGPAFPRTGEILPPEIKPMFFAGGIFDGYVAIIRRSERTATGYSMGGAVAYADSKEQAQSLVDVLNEHHAMLRERAKEAK